MAAKHQRDLSAIRRALFPTLGGDASVPFATDLSELVNFCAPAIGGLDALASSGTAQVGAPNTGIDSATFVCPPNTLRVVIAAHLVHTVAATRQLSLRLNRRGGVGAYVMTEAVAANIPAICKFRFLMFPGDHFVAEISAALAAAETLTMNANWVDLPEAALFPMLGA